MSEKNVGETSGAIVGSPFTITSLYVQRL